MSLQIKSVIETFGAELAVIALVERMSLHMTIQKPLQCKRTVANFTFVLGFFTFTGLVLFLALKV